MGDFCGRLGFRYHEFFTLVRIWVFGFKICSFWVVFWFSGLSYVFDLGSMFGFRGQDILISMELLVFGVRKC